MRVLVSLQTPRLLEETYNLLNQDKIHFYCGVCDKVVGKILQTLTDLSRRQDKLEEKISKVEEELNQGGGKRIVQQDEMDCELKKIREEFGEVREDVKNENKQGTSGGEELKKIQKELGELRTEIEGKVDLSVWHVKEDVEEGLEIERR